MHAFAALLESLILTPQRSVKLRLLTGYFGTTPDPDRGYALAALTGGLAIAAIKPAMLRGLIEERVDPVLFRYSYDYVGDLAETISLLWPASDEAEKDADTLSLSTVVAELKAASRSDGPSLMARFLDRLDIGERWALIKLVTGGMRIGVSARLAKQALADFGGIEVNQVEEVWPGVEPPYESLFAWLEGRGDRPRSEKPAPFRPVMLSTAIADTDLSTITPDTHAAEWKWDGVRVQAVRDGDVARLFTRTGDDISHAFPDLVEDLDYQGALDGELLVGQNADTGFIAGSFSDLQQRLNRKTVSRKQMDRFPAFLRAYDCLIDGSEDIRGQAFRDRRQRLEALVGSLSSGRIDVSPLVSFNAIDDLEAARANPPETVIEGLMLKRWNSIYQPGRPRGPWFKWKRDPHTVDAVLMYAQRGHGKRSSFYSDYTFGVWRSGDGGDELVPVGKAYFGFTDEELAEIDRFVRANTINRFGPVREVVHAADQGLVLEVAFEGLQRSTRHKSGVAMRFPRISRLRWDKPPAEADRIEVLEALLDTADRER